mmetsp:Transcript_53545/g.152571  ORF Transcript_53545/g.152571 Transcript_53545/m.152571 type:complete len:217 (+) Transcript_53545:2137-2787(+)
MGGATWRTNPSSACSIASAASTSPRSGASAMSLTSPGASSARACSRWCAGTTSVATASARRTAASTSSCAAAPAASCAATTPAPSCATSSRSARTRSARCWRARSRAPTTGYWWPGPGVASPSSPPLRQPKLHLRPTRGVLPWSWPGCCRACARRRREAQRTALGAREAGQAPTRGRRTLRVWWPPVSTDRLSLLRRVPPHKGCPSSAFPVKQPVS